MKTFSKNTSRGNKITKIMAITAVCAACVGTAGSAIISTLLQPKANEILYKTLSTNININAGPQ
ncbi:hypothetical protein FACS189496_3830 [Bacilli bacterium]|nr:hypothetical protein FACS189496_3830 [Bacilli bacterium]